MKEQTYGWYPSMRDVYTDRRMGAPTAYELEAMYKYRNSKYYTAPSPPKPDIPGPYRPTETPTKRPGSTVSTRSSKSGYEQELQVRAKSAPIAAFKPIPKLILPTPQQCWATKLPETYYGVTPSPTPSQEITPKPSAAPEMIQQPSPPPASPQAPSVARSDSRRERVKSAVIRRDRPTPPPRPVKSAGPSRSTSSASTSIPVKDDTGRPSSTSSDKYRPINPVSQVLVDKSIPEEVVSPKSEEYDYDKNLKKYGWRMEVHGDPYKLKKVTKRLPYYVKCTEPDLKDDPPKVHMENMETFFYNTIPRRPMAFAVHKEWVSEMIHAKRMELQKREGLKYRYKNFSFVY